MTEQQVLQLLEMYGLSLAGNSLAAPVAALLVATPTLTDAQLVSDEDGTLKHYIRTKIGFFVDIFWGAVEPYVDQAITAAIPQARTLAGVGEPAIAPNP